MIRISIDWCKFNANAFFNRFFFVSIFTAEGSLSGCIEIFSTLFSGLLMILTLPFSLFLCFKVVSEFERAVIFRMGRLRYKR